MEKITYTEALNRLDEIMNRVQNGKLDIDELSGMLKEAQQLVQFCRNKLHSVDEEVKTLLEETASL
ncbi:MAG: exodeoxyribonuclease VII small subunit [Bacteroidaceae bacterium]|jgi:exodeoxyribonuclease VII small subunit|nr:exodeoxyribonuclease VII small subunit [Bacteroidaceae bacterium]